MKRRTLFDKVWDAHVVRAAAGEPSLIYVDLHLVHEVTSPQAFEGLRIEGRSVRRPGQALATMDHNVPTLLGGKGMDDTSRVQIETLARNCEAAGIVCYGMGHANQGIVHVIGPELGLTLPGTTVVCGDSHTSTHGAFGAFAMGIGTSEVEHVLATQCLRSTRPKTMEISIDGTLPFGVTAKDVALHVLNVVGFDGAAGHVVEYTGSVVRGFSMEQRMTLCNMTIEAGGRAGMVAPDETTYAYLQGRAQAPRGAAWDEAVAYWRGLPTDAGARYNRVVRIDAASIAPRITWGTNPSQSEPVTGVVPDPATIHDEAERDAALGALRYMDLQPGTPLAGIAVDHVFIGSCTNARIEDLRDAAAVLNGRTVAPGVTMLVVPGSMPVKRQAEAEGLDAVFKAAGAQWREPGCSMCLGMNPDIVPAGGRCASTSNRNFEGRQGRGARTHLVSPAMAAGAAVAGHFVDVRDLAPEEAVA